jgi:hypothetical protein
MGVRGRAVIDRVTSTRLRRRRRRKRPFGQAGSLPACGREWRPFGCMPEDVTSATGNPGLRAPVAATHGCQAGTLPVAAYVLCGRSSMAEPQPSKLVMRVRFPSPAPVRNPGHTPGCKTLPPSGSQPRPDSGHTKGPHQVRLKGCRAPHRERARISPPGSALSLATSFAVSARAMRDSGQFAVAKIRVNTTLGVLFK